VSGIRLEKVGQIKTSVGCRILAGAGRHPSCLAIESLLPLRSPRLKSPQIGGYSNEYIAELEGSSGDPAKVTGATLNCPK
jgi:hypothetical protein